MLNTASEVAAQRRRIVEYVETHGAVTPEAIRANVLVRPTTASKPARSGADLRPSVPLSRATLDEQLAALVADGVLVADDGSYRVAMPLDTTVETHPTPLGEVRIRAARQEDISGVSDAIDAVAAEQRYITAERLAAALDRDEVLLRQNPGGSRVVFVAVTDEGEDERVVGWLHLERPGLAALAHTAELTVGVVDGYRGHGIGGALMRRALTWAAEQGIAKCYQCLPATNERAVEFLERNGWTVEAVRRDHYRIDDAFVDEVQLAVDPTAR